MAKRRLEELQRSRPTASLPADFIGACDFYKIRTKVGGLLTFSYARWHAEQKRFALERTGRDITLKSRQIGFSTPELLRGLHQAQTREGWNVRVVIHDEELGENLFRTVTTADQSAREHGVAPALSTDRAKELAYTKLVSSISIGIAGAREATAEKQGRSGTIHRLHATELAFWAYPKKSMAGLLNAVPTSGEVLIESTPNGAQGYFYELWQASKRGETEYKPHFYAWHEHDEYRLPVPTNFDRDPRDEHEEQLLRAGVDAEQITWWRGKVQTHTLDIALQEYPPDDETCFRVAGRPYIDQATLDWLTAQKRAPLRTVPIIGKTGVRLGVLLVFEEPRQGDIVIGGADVAEGIGKDAHAAVFIARKTGHVLATFWADDIKPGDFGEALGIIGGDILRTAAGPAIIAPERNNHGHAVLDRLEQNNYPRIFVHEDGRLGWSTNPATRPVMVDKLATAFRDRVACTPDGDGIVEAKALIRDRDGQVRARGKGTEDGAKDDRFFGQAIAWAVRELTPEPTTKTGESPHRDSEARAVGRLL